MFWIFRRTGENLFNAINNSYSIKGKNTKNQYTDIERRAYSRLNQNSEDVNIITKKDSLITDNENEKNGGIHNSVGKKDNNGNESGYLESNAVAINVKTDSSLNIEELSIYSKNKDIIESMTISDDDDDEDFDESHFCSVCDRSFLTNQLLRNHQQKNRHFGCGGCDTIFGDIIHLDHHKEQWEHWTEKDDNHLPCCQRNRRIEFEFTDTDSDSEAESEDLERLL